MEDCFKVPTSKNEDLGIKTAKSCLVNNNSSISANKLTSEDIETSSTPSRKKRSFKAVYKQNNKKMDAKNKKIKIEEEESESTNHE